MAYILGRPSPRAIRGILRGIGKQLQRGKFTGPEVIEILKHVDVLTEVLRITGLQTAETMKKKEQNKAKI